MPRVIMFVISALFVAALGLQPGQASAQASAVKPSSPPVAAASEKPHGALPAQLSKSLDSKKLKQGDAVDATLTAELSTRDGLTIPRGSKLVGHVTEAKARSKGDPQSTLGFVFDKISLPDGKDLAINGVLQAVAPDPNAGASPGANNGPAMPPGQPTAKSAGTTGPPMPSMDSGPTHTRPLLNAQSKGVIGIHHLEMGDNSVLTSTGKEVKLDSGTQLIVMVEMQ